MEIRGEAIVEYNSQSDNSKRAFHCLLNKKLIDRLYEIAVVENIPKNLLLEKMIANYIPIPAPQIPGEFKTIAITEIQRLHKVKPYAIIVSVSWNKKLGFPPKVYHPMRKEMSHAEFQRKYIERLMLPDAQEEIAYLKKMRESHDVYITSFEVAEEGSMRRIFVDFVNGKITWK